MNSMLSQLANIDQDTNLPVNSYDIDLPVWMTMDQSDPFADVELGSDLTNLRDRFFPDSHQRAPDGNAAGEGCHGARAQALDFGSSGGNGKGQGQAEKVRKTGGKKNGAGANGNATSSNVGKGRGGAQVSKSLKKAQGGRGKKSGGAGSSGENGSSPRDGGSANGADQEGATNGTGSRRKKHHNPWTSEETHALIEGVGICGGGRWADIKKLGLKAIERRSAVDLKDKWRNLLRVALLPQQALRQMERKREVSSEMLAKVKLLSTKYKVPNKKARGT